MGGEGREPVRLDELRVLDGPNLYFARPAVKLTLGVPGWLEARPERVQAAAARAGLRVPNRSNVGPARSEQRRRFVVRVAAHLTRSLAGAAGTRLAVRVRPGPDPDQIVVAFPWRRRSAAQALGTEVARALDSVFSTRRQGPRVLGEGAGRLRDVDPGPPPTVPEPSSPVVAVTGTNGKTTTVRLLAHMVRVAGRSVAYSCTDGVYLDGELIEAGDYSGFGGAGKALEQAADVAVLETARGGILLRGIGTSHNDVAVVTNVTSDHLGLLGVRTLDQLAEVKAAITRITRPDGWDVLNADDPRVLAMRRTARGRPWLFSVDPDHPAVRAATDEGGRGMTVIDGYLTALLPGRSRRLVAIDQVPMTLAGISRHNIQNAMAGAAAGLGIGLPAAAVVKALKSFVLDPETNPGRANLFELAGKIVVADYAHNEAGLEGLIEIYGALRRPGAEIWLSYCTAGDRTDEILHAMGYVAGRGADHVVIAELLDYLRGRDREDLVRRLRAGAEDGGARDVPVFVDELHAVEWMIERARPGDVVAITPLIQRAEIFGLMNERGATRVGPDRLRRLVRRARTGR